MQKIMVDTNVLYYLTGLSSNKSFNVARFNQITQNDNCKLAISIFSLIEILQLQYCNSKTRQKEKTLLTYLMNNHFSIVADKRIKLNYNHLYENCLKSKKKIDYYYESITKKLKLYDVIILRDITISVGFIFSAILYKYDKDHKNDEKNFDKYCRQVITSIPQVQLFLSKQYEQIFKDVYNKKPFNCKSIGKEISNLMDVTFQIFYSIYQAIIANIKNNIEFLTIFNNPKVADITIREHRNLFSNGVNNKNIDKYLTILCQEYFNKHESEAVDKSIKEIFKYIFSNRKTEFNDIIDYINLVMPSKIDEGQDKIIYFTLENDWKKIIEKNVDDPYFASCYNFYKLVMG